MGAGATNESTDAMESSLNMRVFRQYTFSSQSTAPTSLSSDSLEGKHCTTPVRLFISRFARSWTLSVRIFFACATGNER